MKRFALLLIGLRCLIAQTSPCDLNADGVINQADVTLAINQALGLSKCTADLDNDGACTAADVQRVINAANGGTCLVTAATGGARGPVADSLIVYETDGANRTSFPISFGRAFAQGEFTQCLQPIVGGASVANYQVDVKNRWPDNSVKFALVSFIAPSLTANANLAVTFQASASCNNSGYLTQAQMLGFNSGNWGAELDVSGGGTTIRTNAAVMLGRSDPASNSFGDCKNDYWQQGPVVTAVIVQDCTRTTAYDFGWTWNGSTMNGLATGNCGGVARCSASLHPWFVLYFFPGSNAVRADMILENTWTDRAQDQLINVTYLTGSGLASQLNYAGVPRKLSDVSLVAGSDVVTSASANFQSSDVGDSFSTMPGGDTTICSVQSPTQATLCAPSGASGSNQTVYLNDWLWGQIYRKTFWTGTGNPGNYLIDHNWPYIVSTGMVAPYDTTKSASPDSNVLQANGCGNNNGTDWSCFSQAVLTNSGLTQTWSDFGDRGGHGGLDEAYSQANGDPTPMSRQALLYLTNMGTCGTANGACAKAWFMLTGTRGARDSGLPASVPGGAGLWNNDGNIAGLHMRESRTTAGHYYCPGLADKNALSSASSCGSSSDTPFGRPPSRYYDPAIYSTGGAPGRPSGSAVYTYGHWTPVPIRFLEWTYSAYLVTGDYYYGLLSQMNGAYAAASLNSTFADYGSNGFFAHTNAQGAILRQSAGTLDAVLKARTVSPDGSVEQTYFDSILASNAEIFEGIMAITGTALTPSSPNLTCSGYSINSSNRWDWGRCTLASYCGAGEPQGTSCTPVAQSLHMPVSGQAESAILANVDAKGFEATGATAGSSTTITNAGGGYSVASPGDTVYCANATGNWTVLNGNHTVIASTPSSLTLNVDTTGVAGTLTGSLACWWGSFGLVTAATSTQPAIMTSTTTPANYGFVVYGATDQSAANWSAVNGWWSPTHVGNNTFSLPVSSSGFPAFSQTQTFYTEMGLKQDMTTDILQGWMEHLWGVVVNEMAGQGVTYFSNVASELNKRLVEMLQDPTYNPWLVAKNAQPIKSPAGGQQVISLATANPYYTSWAQMKAAYADSVQTVKTFYPPLAFDMGSNPCTDHAYVLLARAHAAFLPGVSSGSFSGITAWNWLNANAPFFNNNPASGDPSCGNSDAQIKFALAPR